MKYVKFFTALLAISLLTTSCDSDDEGDAPAPTRSEMLTARNWVITGLNVEPALDVDGDNTQENNLMPYLQACTLDDFQDFNSDNSYTIEEGPSKCDPNDPQIVEAGEWLWNSDGTRLVMNANSETFEAKVTSLSSAEMVWEYTLVQGGVTYTFTQTMN